MLLKILSDNRFFFLPYALFLLLGGILLLLIDTGDVIFFFSEMRSLPGDRFFYYWTKMGEEYGYVVFAIIFLFIRFRWSLIVALTGFLVSVLSYYTKMFFGRPRPRAFYEQTDVTLLEAINLVDGMSVEDLYNNPANSFPSGHTMSGFAFYGILALLLPKRWPVQLALILTAILIGISRVYLVQHFFEDIYAGSLLGVLLALFLYWLNFRFPYNEKYLIDRKIGFKRRGVTDPGEAIEEEYKDPDSQEA